MMMLMRNLDHIFSLRSGFVHGFCFFSCFSKFELPGFILVPVLELFGILWFSPVPGKIQFCLFHSKEANRTMNY